MSPVSDMLFITHASSVTVLAVSVRLHMSIISQDGLSALMLAAYEGHTEVVTQLLEARAKTDLQSTKVSVCQTYSLWKRGLVAFDTFLGPVLEIGI